MSQTLCERRLSEHGNLSVGVLGTAPLCPLQHERGWGAEMGQRHHSCWMEGPGRVPQDAHRGNESSPSLGGGTCQMSPGELDAAPVPAGAVRMRMVRGLGAAPPGPAPANRM